MHVLPGELILRTKEGERLVARPFRAGETVHIPPKLIHQIEAVQDSDVLEASTRTWMTWCGSRTATEGADRCR